MFKQTIVATAIAATLVANPVTAQTKKTQSAKPAPAAVPEIKFEKYELPNGLDVILHVDRKLPVVHVNQWYHVGSKNERVGRTGFAHLFEHMMFQGSKNAEGEHFSYVERAGANLREGGVNGTTSNDRTNYFATVPSGNLEYILWLESDRLATLADVLSDKTLDNQREVVRNERRQSLENQPYGRWFTLMVENLHPKDHPYSWSVIGSHEDLVAAQMEDVRDFFRRYYTPNNLTLTIAGDFEPAEAKRLIAKYFGELPPGPALDRPSQYIPTLDGEKILEVSDRVPQERTYFAWPVPGFFAPDEATLDIASSILTDGLSSRLNKALVYDRQLASDVSSFNNAAEISGQFVVWATARPGSSLAEVEKIVTEEISRLAKSGPTAAETERAKTKWEYQFVTGLEQIGGFGGKADRLAQYNTFLGDPAKFDEDVARYRAVTPAAVKAAAAKWLDTRDRLLIRFRPETSARPSAATLNRAEKPQIGADKRFVVPEVKSAKLENGMEIQVVERNDLPKVAVTFATRAGSVADPANKEGLAHLIIATIDRGTATRKTLDIEDALGDLGTGLNGFAARESSQVSMQLLKRNLKPAMTIMADVIRNPSFPASEVDREKKRHLDSLAQAANNPNAISGRVRAMLQFGPQHPYGRPLQGLPSTVQPITRDDIAAFHKANWKPGSSTLVFAGAITLDEARAIAQETFGSWTGGSAPVVEIPAPQPMAQNGRIYLVDRQGAAQTIVAQMLKGPARTAEDYHAFRVVDSVWGGGGFGTRLNLNLRENKGYSYGVFSNMNLYPTSGAWWAGGGVQTDKTSESVVEFVNELEALGGSKPISTAELTGAKETRVRGYAQQFESVQRIAQQIAELWSLRLPMTELQREADATDAVTAESVAAATKRYVTPANASLLLVGDREKIEEKVRNLKLGDIVILDAEGKPVTK